MLRLYDGNNYYRKVLETDSTGFAPRTILHELAFHNDPVIWCWDGAGANTLRRSLYDGYKRNRIPLRKDIYAGFDLLKEVLTNTRVIQVEIPGYEADDILASFARTYAKTGEVVCIYSNDYDLFQLTAEFPDRVFTGARPKASISADLVRYYKTLVGDPSDNIPGIAGFGEKAWESLGPDLARTLVHNLVTEDSFDSEKLSARVCNWLDVAENRELIRTFWTIVGFYDVDQKDIEANMVVGVDDPDAADKLLKRYML